jgi:hypothetical protein
MRIAILFIVTLSICPIPAALFAQVGKDSTNAQQDTTKAEQIINGIKESKLSKRIMKSITRKKQSDPVAAVKSEAAFMPYDGKIIRNILIRHIDFQRTVYDTTRNIKNTITRLGNSLHSTSKDWVIRDNLFVRENKPVNPYKLADNERHLRDLDFLLEAKFYIIPLKDSPDSVDLVVLTRDVFSLGGTISPSTSRTRFRLYDANLGGWGQRLQFNGIFDPDRDPNFIYEFLYRKNSIGGSFVNGTVGYTQLNTGSSYGEEEEKSYYIRFDRPLVSPYTRYAGGMELSRNWSENFFNVNDTLFRDYRYVINDFWIGYNIGANSNSDRSRHFIAIRGFDQHFTRVPFQPREQERPLYNDQSFVLASATFFKQDFYTTRYIYGFGRTEDVPYGHHVSVTTGWARQQGIARPYIGLEAERSIATRLGEFYTFGIRAGGFTNQDRIEDATVLVSGGLLSRLIPRGQFLFRQSINVDFTRVFRQRTSLPLDINNEFGLQYFRADSLWGTKRFHIQSETVAFSPWQVLGFRFAPFAFAEMAMIADNTQSIFHDKPFFGFGGGIRTRNENLIFGTVELRLIYYPRTIENISSFNIRVTSNLRLKYSAGFVRAPGLVKYN